MTKKKKNGGVHMTGMAQFLFVTTMIGLFYWLYTVTKPKD